MFVREGGSLTISGGSFGGSYTVTGGTTPGGGGATAGQAQGKLIFLHNTATTEFAIASGTRTLGGTDVLAGDGTLAKSGAGTLAITGANANFTGSTTINGGTVLVNGSSSNSAATVNAGGTLGGSGTVGSVTIAGGSIAPGNSIGTINIAGNVDFTGGGNYDVEVDAAGNSDKIEATGTATLTSGIVNVQPEAGDYALSTDYTILTAAGGLGGTTFASVNSSLAFLTPTLSYDANNVYLKLQRNSVDYGSVVSTPNQLAVAAVVGNNAAALQAINSDLMVLTDSGARKAFDSLSGVQHTHGAAAITGAAQQFQQLLFRRIYQGANGALAFNGVSSFDPMQGPLFADTTNNWQRLDADATNQVSRSRGWWLQGFGGFGSIDDTANASGADYRTGGFAAGVDTQWRDYVLGLAGSYAHSDVDPFAGDSDIDSVQVGTYLGWQQDDFYLNASLGLGYHMADASRTVTVGATVNTASSDYETYHVAAAVEVGKGFALNSRTTLIPYAGLEYTHAYRESFAESGAGAANLSVQSNDIDSLRSSLGVRLSHELSTTNHTAITPYLDVAYVREYLDSVSRLEAGFSAVPSSTFRIDGADLDRDRMRLGVGVSGQLNDNTTLNVGYAGELAGSDETHSVAATINFTW